MGREKKERSVPSATGALHASTSSARNEKPTVTRKVFARLSKNCPYIGFFHHAPSAGNRSRQTYFEKDIISTEVIRKQHEVRSNPMIGNFHYAGHDLYGERMEDFQRILSQLRAKDEEREVQAVLNRHAWPFGGPLDGAAISARHDRRRACSIPDSGVLKIATRSISANGCCSAVKAVPTRDDASVLAGRRKKPRALEGRSGGRRLARRFSNGGISTSGDGKAPRPVGSRKSQKPPNDQGDGSGDGEGMLMPAFGGGKNVEMDTPGEDHVDVGEDHVDVTEDHVDVADYLEREERRVLKANAFATVVYASGDSLVKLAEKERRKSASTKRFKYAGAIDVSKSYPHSGSLDDCALLRCEVAERSRLYNDLLAEVNGFRRHFFFRQKMHPKEAYLHARRQRQQEAEQSMSQNQTVTMTMTNVDVYSDDEEEPCMSWSRQKSDSSLMGDVHLNSMTLPAGNGSLAVGSIGGMGGADVLFVENASGGLTITINASTSCGSDVPRELTVCVQRLVGSDDGVPPFHTLVGPGQFLRQDRSSELAKPGDAWMPGTVSALRTKESWRSKQAMRDFHKFKPFFVQAKTDFTATYQLLKDCVLGEGSYATVYLAEHLERGEVVAVKAVQKRLLFSDMEKKSLGREIDNQLRIIHKHVVRLYEVYETPDQVYIVLENCDCGDLEKMMYMRGRLTEIEAKRVTMQLLEALRYVHGKGIVHCDVKPQNLLFAPDPVDPDKGGEGSETSGTPSKDLSDHGKQQVTSPAGKLAKLCDFGISCKVPDVRFYKQTGDINKIPWSGLFGTGGYIAPEIMSQQPFGKAADLWSVGAMLYQMISGRLPFIPARACVSKPVSFPAAVWTDVNIGVKDLICGLLEKDPSQRLTADQALHHPWIQTIQHLQPFFPHFVPKQCRCSSSSSSSVESPAGSINNNKNKSNVSANGGRGRDDDADAVLTLCLLRYFVRRCCRLQ
ncbi:unnamed protein product [Ascophyllum nodosum]